MTEKQLENLEPWQIFHSMNADIGIEMSLEEAQINYAACMLSLVIYEESSNELTIQEMVDKAIEFDAEAHPGIVKKFLEEAIPFMNELDED